MEILHNPHRGRGLETLGDLATRVISDPKEARALFQMCPLASATPLRNEPELARRLGIGVLHLKDESDRMGLGSFKALGAVHAISRLAVERVGTSPVSAEVEAALKGEVFVCASAGNHGLSVALTKGKPAVGRGLSGPDGELSGICTSGPGRAAPISRRTEPARAEPVTDRSQRELTS